MGRQNGDAKVATSSIALLQERFRELQKIREKRQEKQLLKLFSSSSSSSSSSSQSDHDQTPPPPPSMAMHNSNSSLPNQDSLLSLGLNSQNYGATNINNTPSSSSPSSSSRLWPNSAMTSSNSRTAFEYSDVDTSLHL